jgi:uncharacterized iron-regulated protein
VRLRRLPLAWLLVSLVVLAAACGPAALGPWSSSHFRSHPLVGRVYSVASARLVEPSVLFDDASASRNVLLGEQHDNADHHRIQAWIVREMVRRGRRPAVAFEQVDIEKQAALDGARSAAKRDVDAIADAVGWSKSGWPAWREYRPIFEEGVRASLPLVAANLSRTRLRSLMMPGAGPSGDPGDVETLRERAEALPALEPSAQQRLVDQIADSHCGMLGNHSTAPMVTAQRLRDDFLADPIRGGGPEGLVLVAGLEHVRRDYGVPSVLDPTLSGEGGAPLVVGIVEARPGIEAPADYADLFGGLLPFDYLWFTPTNDIEDPCERFAEQLKAMRAEYQENLSAH